MPVGTTIWPVTLDGFLGPVRGTKANQYEFYCHERDKGLQVTCKFKHYTVLGQLHRHTGREGIWLGSDYTNRGSVATKKWHKFVSYFGIKVKVQNKTIAVYLDFYSTPLEIVIRLKRVTSEGIV